MSAYPTEARITLRLLSLAVAPRIRIRWQSTNQIESEDRRRVSERHILFFTAGFPSFLADGVHDSWLYSPEAPGTKTGSWPPLTQVTEVVV